MKNTLNQFRILQVFFLHGIVRYILFALIITLGTACLGAVILPLVNILKTDRGLKRIIPGIDTMIYATGSYEAPVVPDFYKLSEMKEIQEVYFTGTYICRLPSGEQVYVSFLSRNLYDSLELPLQKQNEITTVLDEKIRAAVVSLELKRYLSPDTVTELQIRSSPKEIHDKERLRFTVYPEGFLKNSGAFPSLTANYSNFRTIDNIGIISDPNQYAGFILIREDTEEYYVDHSTALLKVAEGYIINDVLEQLQKKYNGLMIFEDYQTVYRSSFKTLWLDDVSPLMLFLVILLFFLFVNAFGALLISRQNGMRTDMILYQLGLTKRNISGLHIMFTSIISFPWILCGILLTKPLAVSMNLSYGSGFPGILLITIMGCLSIVIFTVGITFHFSQKKHSASEIYKEM